MGRPRFYRQNVFAQTSSAGQKSLFAWLVKESTERFGLSPEEAKLVAQKGLVLLKPGN